MKYSLITACCFVGLILVFGTIQAGDEKTIIEPKNRPGIGYVDIDYVDNRIAMNVHTDAPMTCNQVFKDLGITSFEVKNRTYTPDCVVTSDSLIQVSYIEKSRE